MMDGKGKGDVTCTTNVPFGDNFLPMSSSLSSTDVESCTYYEYHDHMDDIIGYPYLCNTLYF